MAPLPAQISEAIMNFQEKGTIISNRIIMQCFAPELKIRAKRQTSISNEIRVESFESPEDGENNADDSNDEDGDDDGSDDDSLQN
uniref:Uncharacterized protein n=1 Tax=Panagrolaimus sp. ES5 TaxID=591445 RepID=A0AC34FWI7_9BILA